jgi:cytochrome c556
MNPTRTRTLAAVALLALPLVGLAGHAQDQKPKDLKQHLSAAVMRTKLEHSKTILSGLATEDFEAIGKGAKAMGALTVLEQWIRSETTEYKAQLHVFWYANDSLARAAEAKNLDSAALAYTQLTLSCVNCHKYVRRHAAEKEENKL